MKKQVALLTTALLATSFVLGATSCAGKDVSKAIKGVSYSEKTTQVSALTKEQTFNTVDDLGLMVVTKVNKSIVDQQEVVNSTNYKLFDVMTNAFVSGADITIAPTPANLDTLTTYTESSQFQKKTEGFYYTTKRVATRVSVEASWAGADVKTTTALYGKNGQVADGLEGSWVEDVFVTKDAVRYYLDVNGNVAKEEDPLARIVTMKDAQYMDSVGDYLVDEGTSGIYAIYSKDGKYVRTVNAAYELDVPQSVGDEITEWSVGNYMFVQYKVMLPENEKKYDIVTYGEDGAVKYDLVTKRYDVEKNKVKEIDMEYVVADECEYSEYFNDKTTILYVSEIKDNEVMLAGLVQSFDKNGKVAVDLQSLVPGANDVGMVGEDYIMLEAGDMEYFVQGKKVVGEFVKGSVEYVGNTAFVEGNDWIKFYNLDGTLNKAYTDVKDIDEMGMYAVIQLETSIVKYDFMTGTETTVCSYNKTDTVVFEGYYVAVCSAGDIANLEDDKWNIYFLVPGMNNITNLTLAEYDAIEIEAEVSYSVGAGSSMAFGAIFYIEKTTGEGENINVTKDYYNYMMQIAY